jgi:transposase
MAGAVAMTRKDYTAADLRRIAGRTPDGDAARRMLALAHVMDGRSRGEGAMLCGMDRQTLRDWVHRYNAEGLAGLFDRPHCGRPSRLTAEQQAEVARWVRQGPKLSEDGVVRWRLVDLAQKIEKQFGVRLAERSVGSLLRRLGFRRLSVRPHHPGKAIAAQEEFKKTFPIWSLAAYRHTRAASRLRSGGRTKPVSASKVP